ncbi:MAG: type II secretion system F family protein [Candidatus Thermoplasmatota archaeon]
MSGTAAAEGEAPPPVATIGPTAFERLCGRWFGSAGARNLANHPLLGIRLAQARNPLVPSVYLASVYGQVGVAVLVGLLPLVIALVLAGGPVALGVRWIVPLTGLPGLLATATYAWGMLRPDLEAKARRRDVESHLPYALNFMAALASAGVVPVEVFGALGSQRVYGEMAAEANLIYRDTKLFSRDLVTALQAAARRSPSQQLEEFLQGAVSTITSGGDLKTYLLAKAEQFAQENRREQKAFLESLGVMAESYVVVAAAAPLFLLVILSVMMLVSEGLDPTFMLNILVLVALPVIHSMFAYILRTMRPD